MDPENADAAESRPPTLNDLLLLCRSLNAEGARYLIVGGFAVARLGFTRATKACGVAYDEASTDAEVVEIQGVPIPFVSAATLIRMKQTYRQKDLIDRLFLERLIAEKKQRPETD